MATVTVTTSLPDSADKSDFYGIINNATVTEIVNADISASAGIVDTKLATISTANKVNITALTATNQVDGDVIYFNGTAWTRLGIGTAGQTLKVNGGATAPVWA
jgi:hypothetical protein